MVRREVREGTQNQGEDESIAYVIDVSPWGTAPAVPAVSAYDITVTPWVDVSVTVLQGAPSVMGDYVITSNVRLLTAGQIYRIEVQFTCGVNVFEAYIIIQAEK